MNGSGKSSTIKLFNRLYDPTEGEVLLDGKPLPEYRLSDVRRSIAILRQEHRPYPLSVRDNVTLGMPELHALAEKKGEVKQKIDELFQESVRSAGATFIEKLPKGPDTILRNLHLSTVNTEAKKIPEFKPIIEKLDRDISISGGEQQRLAA